MRILHLVYDCIPGVFIGGIQKVVYELARHQCLIEGYHVSIYALYDEDRDIGMGMEFIRDGIHFRYFKPDGKWHLRAQSPELLNELRKNSNDYDVIHSHNVFSPINRYVYSIRNLFLGVVCHHLHGSLFSIRKTGFGTFKHFMKLGYTKLIEVRLLNAADCIFCLSREEYEDAKSWGINAKKLELTNNGVSPHEIDCDRIFDDNSTTILYLGRITPIKNLELIVGLFHFQLKTAKSPAKRLILAGDYSSYPEYALRIKNLVRNYGIDDQVTWVGFVSGKEKAKLFQKADIFIHMSLSEGMPMSVLEALSYGVPTIISKTCGLQNAEQFGALVRTSLNLNIASQVLIEMIDNPLDRRCLSSKAYSYIDRFHDWLEIARNISEKYEARM